jgi:hypothetical protein
MPQLLAALLRACLTLRLGRTKTCSTARANLAIATLVMIMGYDGAMCAAADGPQEPNVLSTCLTPALPPHHRPQPQPGEAAGVEAAAGTAGGVAVLSCELQQVRRQTRLSRKPPAGNACTAGARAGCCGAKGGSIHVGFAYHQGDDRRGHDHQRNSGMRRLFSLHYLWVDSTRSWASWCNDSRSEWDLDNTQGAVDDHESSWRGCRGNWKVTALKVRAPRGHLSSQHQLKPPLPTLTRCSPSKVQQRRLVTPRAILAAS